MFKGINVVSITVPDLDLARDFYRDIFGLGEPVYDLPEIAWVEFSTGGSGGNLAITLPETGEFLASHHTTLVLNVENCAEAVSALRARGVECGEPVPVPGMVTYAHVFDPFGNRLQIVSDLPA
ncbi:MULTISPECIES: VOC family protein [unclassified Devosia]|uniref:VOC family protein n=1 Tax=unclassified Devosia TaxID=196773 RepID=UPI0015550B83|nr:MULTISPECIES: VOC family protein [unclassified Devosia]